MKVINKIKYVFYSMLVILAMYMIGFSYGTNIADEVKNDNVKIAIVNKDNGIEDKNGDIKYYSHEFLNNQDIIKDSSYQTTTLDLAKTGFDNSEYSGYVIIPQDFSKNVASLNTTRTKSTIIYNVNNTNSQILETTLLKINKIINLLDQNISSYYVEDILNQVNNIKSSSTTMKTDLTNNEMIINGISATNWLKPLSLEQAKVISVNDKDLRTYLESLNLIPNNISEQLNNNAYGNNDHNLTLNLNYTNVKDTISQFENSKYYSISSDKLSLFNNYYLFDKTGKKLEILVEKDNATLWIKCQNKDDFIVSDGNNTYNVNLNTQDSNFYFAFDNVLTNAYNLINENISHDYSINGYTFSVFGNNYQLSYENNCLTITNAIRVVINNKTIIPDNNTISIEFSGMRTNNNLDQELLNYNNLSADVLNELNNILNTTPDIPLSEAIMQLESNEAIVNQVKNVTNLDGIKTYMNTISREYFINKFSQINSGINVNNYYTNERGNKQINIIIGLEQTGYIMNDISYTGNKILPVASDIANIDEIKNQTNQLQDNFENFVINVINVDYTPVKDGINNINNSLDSLITDLNNQIDINSEINSNNMQMISKYENDLNQNINNDISQSKNQMITNNNTSINVINSLESGLDNYINDGIVEKSTVSFITNGIEQQIDGVKTDTTPVDKKEDNRGLILLIIGLATGIGVVGYIIHKQNKK